MSLYIYCSFSLLSCFPLVDLYFYLDVILIISLLDTYQIASLVIFLFLFLMAAFGRMEVVKLNVIKFLSLYSALLCELLVYCIKILLYQNFRFLLSYSF